MIKPKFYVFHQLVKAPLNWQEFALELNFDLDNPARTGQVSSNDWTFGVGDSNDEQDATVIIRTWAEGPYGVFEAVPFQIKMDINGDGVDELLFDGYLDLTETDFLCHEITVTSKEDKGIDWLNEVADSFTFNYLYQYNYNGAGKIVDSDFVITPFQKHNPSDTFRIVVVLLTLFSISFQVWNLVKVIIGFVKSVKTITGGEIVFAIIDMLVQLIQLLVNINTFNSHIFQYLFDLVKYKAGMYLQDLCIKGAAHLGYKFESNIFGLGIANYRTHGIGFDNVVCFPEVYSSFIDGTTGKIGIEDSRARGELNGVYNGTFGDLLRELKKMFNAKLIVDDNGFDKILRLERRDFLVSTDLFQLPDLDRSEIPYKYNTDALKAHYSLSYKVDLTDYPALIDYEGTEVQVITGPRSTFTTPLMKGEEVHNINFGLTSYKVGLTAQEQFLRGVIPFYFVLVSLAFIILAPLALIVNAFIVITNEFFEALESAFIIDDFDPIPTIRIRAMLNPLQSYKDHFDNIKQGVAYTGEYYGDVPKLVAVRTNYTDFKLENGIENTRQGYRASPDQRALLSAEFLYDRFHVINSFVGNDHNQHIEHELTNVPFCVDDYRKVSKNNRMLDADGSIGEILSLKWNIYNQTADIRFQIKRKYTDNLVTTKVLSDGR